MSHESVRAVKQGSEAQEWNRTTLEADGSFLQSFEWGQFQESLGRRIIRLNSRPLRALLVKLDLPFGKSYLYCPRGPLFDIRDPAEAPDRGLSVFLEAVGSVQEREKCIFIKIEPEWEWAEEDVALLRAHRFIRSDKEIQPAQTLILDISKPEDVILDEMKKKTRYGMRLAARKGVTVKRLGLQGCDAFLDLLQETAKRNRFQTHPHPYYRKLLEFLQGDGQVAPAAELWGAEYEGRLLAANLVIFWGKRATYLHGASSSAHRDAMASYALHWEIIKDAKSRGYQQYDLWGISRKWPGVTRFKEGFGGKEVTYAGSYDFVFRKPWYFAYRLSRSIL